MTCLACGEPVKWILKTFPAPGGGTFKCRSLVDADGRNHFALCEWAEAHEMDRVEAMVFDDR